ncbi:hypothetical protein Agub_g12053 [Astrephomene gubernaculifera]|uniref:Uncharacterized protein n=1 Tax=Astrephomene gubernaculifera TaxID=47775 RepID=A0AAD3DXN1_9CHLO|nr:hypothetical protein Agub_g12053 [Astrephomene gubernaculifera]
MFGTTFYPSTLRSTAFRIISCVMLLRPRTYAISSSTRSQTSSQSPLPELSFQSKPKQQQPPEQEPSHKLFDLYRIDDNANEFLMATFAKRVEAEQMMLEFESRGHKQVYFIRTRPKDPQ